MWGRAAALKIIMHNWKIFSHAQNDQNLLNNLVLTRYERLSNIRKVFINVRGHPTDFYRTRRNFTVSPPGGHKIQNSLRHTWLLYFLDSEATSMFCTTSDVQFIWIWITMSRDLAQLAQDSSVSFRPIFNFKITFCWNVAWNTEMSPMTYRKLLSNRCFKALWAPLTHSQDIFSPCRGGAGGVWGGEQLCGLAVRGQKSS